MLPKDCPKCGGALLGVVYIECDEENDEEALLITCNRCTYSWYIPTLDNQKENEA